MGARAVTGTFPVVFNIYWPDNLESVFLITNSITKLDVSVQANKQAHYTA